MSSPCALISSSFAFTKVSTLSSSLLQALSEVCELRVCATQIFGGLYDGYCLLLVIWWRRLALPRDLGWTCCLIDGKLWCLKWSRYQHVPPNQVTSHDATNCCYWKTFSTSVFFKVALLLFISYCIHRKVQMLSLWQGLRNLVRLLEALLSHRPIFCMSTY